MIREADALADEARIVAAAPDLLEACELLIAAFPIPKIKSENGFSRCLALNAARKAVDKARGGRK